MKALRCISLTLALICVSCPIVLLHAQDGQIRLRPGDDIEIRLAGVPAEEQAGVNRVYTIDEGGTVNLPHIGRIRAAEMTASQLERSIEGAYRFAEIYTNPTINITVSASSRFVVVGGAVRAPQRVVFTPDLTLIGAINSAGSFNEFADQKRVRILRGDNATVHDVRAIRNDPSRDIPLRPGDRIEVPVSRW
ncbi:MAG: polysaccharide biosynthesis/export family protein [Verrucomicrobiales bacterium]